MYATLLSLALAAPALPSPTVDRHGATRAIEAHRVLQAEHQKARTAASELYHYATHRLDLEREVAQRMVVDISRAVEASAGKLTALRESLTPTQRKDAATELQLITDWHGKATSGVAALKSEVAKPAPDGRELRFHTSAVYGALDGAADIHTQLMQRLKVQVAQVTGDRAR